MQAAIQNAIEGGWRKETVEIMPEFYLHHKTICFHERNDGSKAARLNVPISAALLDPLFWQCLGKAMGWEPNISKEEIERMHIAQLGVTPRWPIYWHNFISHLAEGRSADEFFNELIK